MFAFIKKHKIATTVAAVAAVAAGVAVAVYTGKIPLPSSGE